MHFQWRLKPGKRRRIEDKKRGMVWLKVRFTQSAGFICVHSEKSAFFSKMGKITYCKNSTITEAWAKILGFPGKRNEEEIGALAYFGKKRFDNFQPIPSVVLIDSSLPDIPPCWEKQLTWDEGKLLARIGHRFLSVHYLNRGRDPYQTFDQSLQPSLEGWLDVYRDTLSSATDEYLVDQIGFGYVNRFQFAAKDFDLSRHFRLSLGIDIAAAQNGISGIETTFRLVEKEVDTSIVVNLQVDAGFSNNSFLQVQTKIFAERQCKINCSFKDKELILQEIAHVKEIAKATFFDFATDETHQLMEAHYASDES
ncbi:MAG: hypothetical protein HY774_11840 [Acidobacteria bacterium]|nr:hypothetical protein [Acidobacteriota bacterium]